MNTYAHIYINIYINICIYRICPDSAVLQLHRAELQINKNEFYIATGLLRKAQKLAQSDSLVPYTSYISTNYAKNVEGEYKDKKVSSDSAYLLFIGHLLMFFWLLVIDVFLYLCLFGWSIWKHMV
jgi:hypothetical protein